MADPLNPRLSGPDLLELILRQNPRLTRDVVLAVASAAGFDLLDLRPQPRSPQATTSGKPSGE